MFECKEGHGIFLRAPQIKVEDGAATPAASPAPASPGIFNIKERIAQFREQKAQ